MKDYCTQNEGDCSTCSLVSYNKDCQNNPVHGGSRPGAGRKLTGRKKLMVYVTDEEAERIREFIETMRGKGNHDEQKTGE